MPRDDAQPAENSTTRVTAKIRAAIIAGEFSPASRLRTEALATRFGTSRSPVREALLTLEREGLVETLPNRGAVVRAFEPVDLLDLYRLRCVLEPYAAARAAGNMGADTLARIEEICDAAEQQAAAKRPSVEALIGLNNQFHADIVDAAESPRLAEAMKGTAGLPLQFRGAFWSVPEQRDLSLSHHREILAALRAGNAQIASTAMEVHMLQSIEFLEAFTEGSASSGAATSRAADSSA
jgi:DNA-binding GntR family transcriptional regulator